jgi:urate oxidase
VRDLVVLKTTASEWRDFHTDPYRTLPDTSDRILATSIDADWVFSLNVNNSDFDAHHDGITRAMLVTFATQHSLGAQQTLKAMGDAALAACPAIASISISMPNLHRIPFNFEPYGLKFENDVFVATDAPHGLIKGTITRNQ